MVDYIFIFLSKFALKKNDLFFDNLTLNGVMQFTMILIECENENTSLDMLKIMKGKGKEILNLLCYEKKNNISILFATKLNLYRWFQIGSMKKDTSEQLK